MKMVQKIDFKTPLPPVAGTVSKDVVDRVVATVCTSQKIPISTATLVAHAAAQPVAKVKSHGSGESKVDTDQRSSHKLYLDMETQQQLTRTLKGSIETALGPYVTHYKVRNKGSVVHYQPGQYFDWHRDNVPMKQVERKLSYADVVKAGKRSPWISTDGKAPHYDSAKQHHPFNHLMAVLVCLDSDVADVICGSGHTQVYTPHFYQSTASRVIMNEQFMRLLEQIDEENQVLQWTEQCLAYPVDTRMKMHSFHHTVVPGGMVVMPESLLHRGAPLLGSDSKTILKLVLEVKLRPITVPKYMELLTSPPPACFCADCCPDQFVAAKAEEECEDLPEELEKMCLAMALQGPIDPCSGCTNNGYVGKKCKCGCTKCIVNCSPPHYNYFSPLQRARREQKGLSSYYGYDSDESYGCGDDWDAYDYY